MGTMTGDGFDGFFGGFDQRLIDQVLTRGHGWGLAEPTPPGQIPEALGGTLTPEMTARAMDQTWTARKLSATILVPNELLMDAGVIPDTRPPRAPLPWRTRLRFRLDDWREKLARRAYKLIAGYDVPEPEDW
jgi:hypothetical protein